MHPNKLSAVFGAVSFALFGILFATTAAGQPSKPGRFKDSVSAKKFFKGNIHTHTSETDGDAPPDQVVNWYKKNGYDFLSVTDHDKLTPTPPGITNEKFITLNGVELTGLAVNRAPVHVNAICGKSALKGVRNKEPVLDVLKANIALSRDDGAITMVNHPNFGWAIKRDDLLKAADFDLLEIASGHFLVNDRGDEKDLVARPSSEMLWDMYLTNTGPVFGAAVDDSHNYHEFRANLVNPGRAWLNVWAPSLTNDSICEAIRKGHFYSTKISSKNKFRRPARDIEIKSLVVSSNRIEVRMARWAAGDKVAFIGADGKVLKVSKSNPSRYTLKGGEKYVRAYVKKVGSGTTLEAWTQPYFVTYE